MMMDSNSQVRHTQGERGRIASRHLLGSNSRLAVAMVIASHETGLVFARGIAESLGLPDNVVRADLKKLAAAGFLTEHERLSGNQRVYFERVDSVLWESVIRLGRELEAP
jgi:predicted transcriptional regulator